jgi:hypothetical protein
MVNRCSAERCRIALARELEVAPDNLDVLPVLEMIEGAQFYGREDEKQANLMPDNDEQEKAIMNQYYPIVLEKIFQSQHPFEGFLQNMMQERGII